MSHCILVPETSAPDMLLPLQGRSDIVLKRFGPKVTAPEFRALLGNVNAMVLGVTPIADAELDAAPQLKAVARVGVGYDAIDVPALTRRRIPLLITGTANSVSVAEQALAFMFAFAKRLNALHSLVVEQRWSERFVTFPYDLAGKRVLIVGFGRIGSRMAKRCVAMEMDTQVYDPLITQDYVRAVGATPVPDLDAALAEADYVSIHCPKDASTVDLFDAARLARMKKGAVLINTARGGIVNEAALAQALTSGHLSGAGLDVLLNEPPEQNNPLVGLPNVICAPHMAGVAWEAWNRMARSAMQNVLDVLDGKPNREHTVNPQVYDAR